MKILQVSTGVNTGSTGRIAEDIGRTMIENGHESYIAYGRGKRPSASKLIRIGSELDVYMHGMKTIITDRHGFGSTAATKKFISEIERIQPDVIGLHNLHGYYLNIEVLFNYLSLKDIPVFWTLHDCWTFTGHCSYFDDIACEKWKTQCENCPKTKFYPSSYLLDNSRKNYNQKKTIFNSVRRMQIIVPSDWLNALTKQSYLGSYPIRTIRYGIDTEVFHPVETDLKERLGLGDKKVVLGCANIWNPRKGLPDLMWLSSELPADHVLVVVGVTEEQQKNLPPNMRGVHRTESVQQLAEYYSMADVFVNPTYQDNFPVTNLESLACGTPVVTYETGGCPEAVDTMTGTVVPKGDKQALKKAVLDTIGYGKQGMTGKCRERAVANFKKETQYAMYLDICRAMTS